MTESRQVRRARMRKEAPMPEVFMKNGKRIERRWFARTYAQSWWQAQADEVEARMSGSTMVMEND